MQLLNNKLTISLLIKLSLLPLFVLAFIALFLLFYFNVSIDGYITSQKSLFIFINQELAAYQTLQLNLTQLGDALVLFPFITLVIKRYPAFCASLFVAAPLAGLSSIIGKAVFAMPRPAAILDHSQFNIIGPILTGHTSLPSGHAITIFLTLTIILFSFMPNEIKMKILWTGFILLLALLLAFSRVAVGAHWPLDVLVGACLGYFSALSGMVLIQQYPALWRWMNYEKSYLLLSVILFIWSYVLLIKAFDKNIFIIWVSTTLTLLSALILFVGFIISHKNK